MPKEKLDALAVELPTGKPAGKPAAAPEPEYTAEEFIEHPTQLGYGKDIVAAALGFAKVERCTLSRAKELVKHFAERKV